MSGPGSPRPTPSTATAVCSGDIHEAVEQQILAAGTGIWVSTFSHFGYLAEGERWKAKQNSYHRITSLAVQEAPLNTHLWLQMDIAEKTARKNVQAALECFEQAVMIDPEFYDAWRSIGLIQKAERSSHQGLRLSAGCR
jgi:hypothetical protein